VGNEEGGVEQFGLLERIGGEVVAEFPAGIDGDFAHDFPGGEAGRGRDMPEIDGPLDSHDGLAAPGCQEARCPNVVNPSVVSHRGWSMAGRVGHLASEACLFHGRRFDALQAGSGMRLVVHLREAI